MLLSYMPQKVEHYQFHLIAMFWGENYGKRVALIADSNSVKSFTSAV